MKYRFTAIKLILVLSAIFAFATPLRAKSLNAFTVIIPDKWVGVTMSLRGNLMTNNVLSASSGWDFNVAYALSSRASIKVAVSGWGIFRYDFLGQSRGIAALMIGSSYISPQFHSVLKTDGFFSMEINIAPYFSYSDLSHPNLTAILSPLFQVGENFYLFLESDPSYNFADSSFDLTLSPGICAKIGGGWTALGIKYSGFIAGQTDIQYGMWYWVGFDSRPND